MVFKRVPKPFVAAFSAALLLVSGSPATHAVDVRTVDVVTVTWQGAQPFSVSTGDIERSIRDEVNANWLRFTTLEGDARDRAISFQLGRTLVSSIVINKPLECEGSGFTGFMGSIRSVAYERLGISDSKSRYLVILVPNNGCIWSGRANMGSAKTPGGTMTLHDTSSAFVITHELGHTLGLGHSNFLRCNSGAFDGAWGQDCRAVEYGGTIDVMGNVETDSTLSTYHQWRMGLLDENEIKESWINEKIELTASDAFGGYRAIFIRDSKSTYWIEYRRVQSDYKSGLAIYRTDPPPASAVISPNSQDLQTEFDDGVATDIWMLNWDNYRYVSSRASGSMTLPQGKIATFFSKNVAISAEPVAGSTTKVLVTINRKVDTTPPPMPALSDPSTWNYPDKEILEGEYADTDSIIAGYEARVNEKSVDLVPSTVDNWKATYLNPILAPKTLHLRDLPEGSYVLSVRTKDIWGNVSPWSSPKSVVIDRGEPSLANDFRISSMNDDGIDVIWSGAKDVGSGLCETILYNNEGWVTERSLEKSAPKFRIPLGQKTVSEAHVFDCRGNGKRATISVEGTVISADSRRGRSGTWVPAPKIYGSVALQCKGKCTISFSVKGPQNVLMGDGAAEVYISNRLTLKIPNSTSGQLRTSEQLNTGAKNAVVRVQGQNFILVGLSSLTTQVSDVASFPRMANISDPTLNDSTQKRLGNLGFRLGDFIQGWTILPMARGTTLLDPTLDLCGSSYKSESGRELRRQISVTKVGSPYSFLSTEVVKYRNKAAADAAIAELKTNFAQCITNKGGIENSVFTDYSFQNLPTFKNGLVDEGSRVVVRATIGKGTAARQLFGVYQFKNEYFTGLYIIKPGAIPIPDDEVLRWLDVASTMATRLSQFN